MNEKSGGELHDARCTFASTATLIFFRTDEMYNRRELEVHMKEGASGVKVVHRRCKEAKRQSVTMSCPYGACEMA